MRSYKDFLYEEKILVSKRCFFLQLYFAMKIFLHKITFPARQTIRHFCLKEGLFLRLTFYSVLSGITDSLVLLYRQTRTFSLTLFKNIHIKLGPFFCFCLVFENFFLPVRTKLLTPCSITGYICLSHKMELKPVLLACGLHKTLQILCIFQSFLSKRLIYIRIS